MTRVERAGDPGVESGASGLLGGKGGPASQLRGGDRDFGVRPPRGVCGAAQHGARMGLALGRGMILLWGPGRRRVQDSLASGPESDCRCVDFRRGSASRWFSAIAPVMNWREELCCLLPRGWRTGNAGIQMNVG